MKSALSNTMVFALSGLCMSQQYRAESIVVPGVTWNSYDRVYLAEDGTVSGSGSNLRGFIWSPSGLTLTPDCSLARKNSHGQYAATSNGTVPEAGRWENGVFNSLGVGRSEGRAIDEDGFVAGSLDNTYFRTPFITTAAGLQLIPGGGTNSESLTDMNTNHQVVAGSCSEGNCLGFYWDSTNGRRWLTSVNIPLDMNNRGEVIGTMRSWYIMFADATGEITNLGPGLGGGLNDCGDVVASLFNPVRYEYDVGAIGTTTGSFLPLQGMLAPGTPYIIREPIGINNARQILAHGVDQTGERVLLVLTPVPEPGTLIALVVGSLIIVKRRRTGLTG